MGEERPGKVVRIPFFNVDVPQPTVQKIVPKMMSIVIRACTHAVDGAIAFAHPQPVEVDVLFSHHALRSMPKEMHQVLKKNMNNEEEKNSEELSSEVVDASFAFYRRMLRTAIVGETDEEFEDVTAAKLGLDQPSAREEVWERFRYDQALGIAGGPHTRRLRDIWSSTEEEEEDAAREAKLQILARRRSKNKDKVPKIKKGWWGRKAEKKKGVMQISAAAQRRESVAAAEALLLQARAGSGGETLQRKKVQLFKVVGEPWSERSQVLGAAFNAGLGISLGVLVIKGLGPITRLLQAGARKLLPKGKGQGKKRKPAVKPGKIRTMEPTAAATTPAASGGKTGGAAPSAPAASTTKQAAATTAAKKKEEEESKAAATKAPRPARSSTARKR